MQVISQPIKAKFTERSHFQLPFNHKALPQEFSKGYNGNQNIHAKAE